MKTAILILLISFLPAIAYNQTEDKWTAFEDKETQLIGFKDSNGEIKIKPKYSGVMFSARKFSNIAAVMEENNESYYLLKNGHRFGKDSLFIFDTGFDCESEGFIRFLDTKNKKAGIFNSEGKVVIPAEYDDITPLVNGLAVGFKGTQKEYLDKDSEHWRWTGGTEYLIDSENNILVKGFTFTEGLDFHSIKIEDAPSEEPWRENFMGINGKYYTFNDNERLFKHWLSENFLNELSRERIIENSYPEIVYWMDNEGWTAKESKIFITDNYEVLKERIAELSGKELDNYTIYIDDFITCPEGMESEFEKYMDNCGNLKSSQYPCVNVVIGHELNGDFYQDNFGFLKTDNGFKLLNVTVRNTLLK